MSIDDRETTGQDTGPGTGTDTGSATGMGAGMATGMDAGTATGTGAGMEAGRDAALRQEARARIERKRGFWTHAAIYVAINAMLVVIWVWTGATFFWPVIPLVLWGIGLGADAWDAFAGKSISEERLRREMDRMRRS